MFLKIPYKTHFLLVTHIFSVAKQIYNIIHSSIQKHKQNPEKNNIKSDQIERRRKRERWLGSMRGEIARHGAAIAIDAVLRSCCDDQTQFKWEREIEIERNRQHELRTPRCNLAAASGVGPLRLWVVLSLSLFPFARLWAPLFVRLNSESDLKVK